MIQSNARRGYTQSCFPKGFTLIELLVVVLIIGILAAVAVPQYQKVVDKAHVTEALLYVDTFEKAISTYVLQHGIEDANFTGNNATDLDISLPFDTSNDGGFSCKEPFCYQIACLVRQLFNSYPKLFIFF